MTGNSPFIISCEHGGNAIPTRYAYLFRGANRKLNSHSGYDPGALRVARYLAQRMDAPLFAATVSRLLIDLNRSLHHRQIFSEWTRTLDAAARHAIIEKYYLPYRARVTHRIAETLNRGQHVVHLSIHSFTPRLAGNVRTCDIGLLYDPARRAERDMAARWIDALRACEPRLRVRRNYPYRGIADGFTRALRSEFGPSYCGIEVEINQRFFLDARRSEGAPVAKALLQAITMASGVSGGSSGHAYSAAKRSK